MARAERSWREGALRRWCRPTPLCIISHGPSSCRADQTPTRPREPGHHAEFQQHFCSGARLQRGATCLCKTCLQNKTQPCSLHPLTSQHSLSRTTLSSEPERIKQLVLPWSKSAAERCKSCKFTQCPVSSGLLRTLHTPEEGQGLPDIQSQVTESETSWNEALEIISSSPPLSQGHLELVAQKHVPLALAVSREWVCPVPTATCPGATLEKAEQGKAKAATAENSSII